MPQAKYEIVGRKDGDWIISHDGDSSASYLTKEAAFEAAVGAASNAIKEGYEIVITVEGSSAGEPAMGKH